MSGMSIEFAGLGRVAKDKAKDSIYIEINPIEGLPTSDGKLGEKNEVTTDSVDSKGNVTSVVSDRTAAITARWLSENTSNIISAPQVVAGETVEIYKLAGGKEYGWKTYGTDMDIRKRDRYIVFVSAKPSQDRTSWLTKGYYMLMDAIDKKFHIHTSKADDEPVAYDLVFDTKLGKFFLMDDANNSIELDSVSGDMEFIIRNKVHFKLKKFEVDNGVVGLVQNMVNLCDAIMSEVHIDSMRGNTKVSPGTIEKVKAIKANFQAYL